MNLKKIFSNFDYVLLFLVIIIFSIGILVIASATNYHELGFNRKLTMQLTSFGIGILIILVLQLFDYEFFGEIYIVFYVLSILFLLLVHVPGLGVVQFGAKRWIALGPIYVQTSELTKLSFIIFFSKFLEKNGGVKSFVDVIKCGLWILPIFALIYKQPDLGGSLVVLFIAFGMMFVSGLQYRYLLIGGGALVIGAPIIYKFLEPHQKSRIDAFLYPDNLTLPGNYHVMQSKITIGSGQMYGKGLFNGIYHRLNYLPVQESDFIFAVFVEETGYVGGVILIALYCLFLLRLVFLSYKAKDSFGSIIIIGVCFMFAFQIIENIGMNMGVMPVTGVTLPFFSYGATSIVTSLAAIGLVETVHVRRKHKHFQY